MRSQAARVALLLSLCAALAAQTRRLDTTVFVVLGEGLAAGVHDFGLRSEYQAKSFPALVARQIGAILPQPLMEGPGLAVIPGLSAPAAILPNSRQKLVREGFPPSLFVFNLSVPGMRVAESIARRPAEPLIQTANLQQTAINLILGYPSLILGKNKPLWSQLEYAEAMNPTLALVCLGYHEAADAAAAGDAARLPEPAAFRSGFDTILRRLRANFAEVLVTNVPDPFDTGYFTPLSSVPQYVGASQPVLTSLYGLQPGDYVTPAGLMAIGNQLLSRQTGPLPAGAFVRAASVTAIRARLQQMNSDIAASAQQGGAALYDLQALLRQVRSGGVVLGNRLLSADYLGGFYSLSGFYPGLTGHAMIANGLIGLINQRFARSFPLLDTASIASGDPALRRIPQDRKPGEPRAVDR